MKRGLKIIGATALVLAGALPAAADVTEVTCADFMVLDTNSKKWMAGEILAWITASENALKKPNLIAKYASPTEDDKWTPDNFVIEIEGHCKDAISTTSVIARLDEHS